MLNLARLREEQIEFTDTKAGGGVGEAIVMWTQTMLLLLNLSDAFGMNSDAVVGAKRTSVFQKGRQILLWHQTAQYQQPEIRQFARVPSQQQGVPHLRSPALNCNLF